GAVVVARVLGAGPPPTATRRCPAAVVSRRRAPDHEIGEARHHRVVSARARLPVGPGLGVPLPRQRQSDPGTHGRGARRTPPAARRRRSGRMVRGSQPSRRVRAPPGTGAETGGDPVGNWRGTLVTELYRPGPEIPARSDDRPVNEYYFMRRLVGHRAEP